MGLLDFVKKKKDNDPLQGRDVVAENKIPTAEELQAQGMSQFLAQAPSQINPMQDSVPIFPQNNQDNAQQAPISNPYEFQNPNQVTQMQVDPNMGTIPQFDIQNTTQTIQPRNELQNPTTGDIQNSNNTQINPYGDDLLQNNLNNQPVDFSNFQMTQGNLQTTDQSTNPTNQEQVTQGNSEPLNIPTLDTNNASTTLTPDQQNDNLAALNALGLNNQSPVTPNTETSPLTPESQNSLVNDVQSNTGTDNSSQIPTIQFDQPIPSTTNSNPVEIAQPIQEIQALDTMQPVENIQTVDTIPSTQTENTKINSNIQPIVPEIKIPDLTNVMPSNFSMDFSKNSLASTSEEPKPTETKPVTEETQVVKVETTPISSTPIKKTNLFEKVGVFGLRDNSMDVQSIDSSKSLVNSLISFGSNIIVDSTDGKTAEILSGLNTSKINIVNLKTFLTTTNDNSQSNIAGTNIIYSNLLEKIRHLVKESRAYIFCSLNTLDDISIFSITLNIARIYKEQHKPIILFGDSVKIKFQNVKTMLGITPEDESLITFSTSSDEVLKTFNSWSEKVNSNNSINAPRVVDRRVEGDERDFVLY